MPDQEIAYLLQTALLWPFAGYDGYGQHTVGPVQELLPPYHGVRWNDNRSEAMDPKGNTVSLDASVIVSKDIAIGSRMWRGTLEEWNGAGTGSVSSQGDLYEVKTTSRIPDLRNSAVFRQLGLMRYRRHG